MLHQCIETAFYSIGGELKNSLIIQTEPSGKNNSCLQLILKCLEKNGMCQIVYIKIRE